MKKFLTITVVMSFVFCGHAMEVLPKVQKSEGMSENKASKRQKLCDLLVKQCEVLKKEILEKEGPFTLLAVTKIIAAETELHKAWVEKTSYKYLIGQVHYHFLVQYFQWYKHNALPDTSKMAKTYARVAYKVFEAASVRIRKKDECIENTEETEDATLSINPQEEGYAPISKIFEEKKVLLDAITTDIACLEDLHAQLNFADRTRYDATVCTELKLALSSIYTGFFYKISSSIENKKIWSGCVIKDHFVPFAAKKFEEEEWFWDTGE